MIHFSDSVCHFRNHHFNAATRGEAPPASRGVSSPDVHKLASSMEGNLNTNMVSGVLMLIYAIKICQSNNRREEESVCWGLFGSTGEAFSLNVSFCAPSQKSGRTSAPTRMLTLLLFPELVKTTKGKLKRGF